MKKQLILLVTIIIMTFNGIAQTIPTRDEFFNVCDSFRIHHPYVVYAQARLESGNFKSTCYKAKNNCLGIYDSKEKCYKKFNNWIECLKSYRNEVQYRCKNINCTDEEYLSWLVSIGYAKDKNYYNTILSIVNFEKRH